MRLVPAGYFNKYRLITQLNNLAGLAIWLCVHSQNE